MNVQLAYYNSNLMRLQSDERGLLHDYAYYASEHRGSVARTSRHLPRARHSVAAIYTRDLMELQLAGSHRTPNNAPSRRR